MVRYPISFEQQTFLKRGTWTPEEDQKLIAYISRYGIWNWNEMPKYAGLFRTGKSCRLRWMNYLRPGIKRGNFTKEEEETILNLRKIFGNRWAAIAQRMPQRTDNEIKNYWNTRLKKRAMENSTANDDGNHSSNQAKQNNSLERNSSSETVSSLEDASLDTVFHSSPTLGDCKPGENDFGVYHETHITNEENAGNLFDIYEELQGLWEQPMPEALEDSQTIINENFIPATSQLWLDESTFLCDSYYTDPVDDFWLSSSI
ncbi:hypothetical protein SLE2022_094270 [Rubroshorea leprosula]